MDQYFQIKLKYHTLPLERESEGVSGLNKNGQTLRLAIFILTKS